MSDNVKEKDLELVAKVAEEKINQQQAEIERLNSISDRLNDICTKQDLEIEKLKAKNLDLEFELKAMQHAANLLKKKSKE